MKLPEYKPLDARVLALLEKGTKIAEVSDQGTPFPFLCPLLYSPDGKVLLLGLEQERTEAGRGLIGALWFEKAVTIWLSGGEPTYRLIAYPWQCHITGERFRQALDRFRKTQPRGELFAVWELYPQDWEETDQLPPEPKTPALLTEAETHLELLRTETVGK